MTYERSDWPICCELQDCDLVAALDAAVAAVRPRWCVATAQRPLIHLKSRRLYAGRVVKFGGGRWSLWRPSIDWKKEEEMLKDRMDDLTPGCYWVVSVHETTAVSFSCCVCVCVCVCLRGRGGRHTWKSSYHPLRSIEVLTKSRPSLASVKHTIAVPFLSSHWTAVTSAKLT